MRFRTSFRVRKFCKKGETMPEITDISPQVKDKERCNVYVDGRFYCGLKLETAIKYRLKVGEQIELEKLDEIQLENERSQALDKAMTHLSHSMKTEKEIRDFLKKKGYVGAVCDYAVQKLEEYGFLDDAEYCRQYVASAGKSKGSRLIAFELKRRGAKEECIEAALSENAGEADAALSALRKYMRGREFSRENLSKAFRHLLSKGFDYDTAKDALAALGADEED